MNAKEARITAPCEWSCYVCGAPIDGLYARLVKVKHAGITLGTCPTAYCVDRAQRGDIMPPDGRSVVSWLAPEL